MNHVIEDYKRIGDKLKQEGVSVSETESYESVMWKVNSVGEKDVLGEHLQYNSFKQVVRGIRLYMIFGFWVR